ncbi:hypothetical protein EGY07_12295 [Chryseobacterium indologenes]|uniref:hypothetical protein n=1 Tax=Chryseobacterium TaxID=59732 RepID=UPI0004872E65|nr:MULTISPECIES: hypothetical protein [Chryseobacterium]AYZ36302.1 hypothetical protein EGY07_12295 [Chryseobacterium indologenes]MBF6644951.1 hypothetical protein [Chryseobacterium indologenes]MEB4759226.1 hypothetical protein [Chryseobacterium indologenes]QQQ71367.1 hypothetical protein JHW31_01165 [Chryseobacterium indologenes]
MKTIKYISLILILLSISCCVNQKQKDEEEIKNTIREYWKAVKTNDLQKCNSLIYDNETFFGVIQGEFYFLHDNYNKVNPNDILLKNIKIKDTVVMFAENKQKYVQYTIKKENDTTYLKKPLIITFMFYRPVGFNKIYNPVILENHIGWDK